MPGIRLTAVGVLGNKHTELHAHILIHTITFTINHHIEDEGAAWDLD